MSVSDLTTSSTTYPVVFLLAVWGKSFIEKFFRFSLPTLLAPGNIPSLSKKHPSTFIFLTNPEDIPLFEKQQAFKQLAAHCMVEFLDISDFIFDGNYSATLTLAYERGMRSRKEKMCDTYFFFLVSDYLMANGSLTNVSKYLNGKTSGITTGNFLVIEEYMSSIFQKIIDEHDAKLLSLNSREMLKLSFPYIHPVSLAQTVTQPFTHAAHANRLFWKANNDVIVGRFYLRHMLAIKPELNNFKIGASSDYSFIPEMCPSGNVTHIQDSDEYCVIEMAPYLYEQHWIKNGAFNAKNLAKHLSEWTNSTHRKNAYFPVIYHSQELKELPEKTIQDSQEFIQEIEKQLKPDPQPTRGHPYWISCVESILDYALKHPKKEKYVKEGTIAGILGSLTFSPGSEKVSEDRFLLSIHPKTPKRLKGKLGLIDFLIGSSPNTSFWQLHWFDDRQMKQDIKKNMAQVSSCAVLLFESNFPFLDWLDTNYPSNCTYLFYDLLKNQNVDKLQTLQNIEHLIIWLSELHVCELGEAIRLCIKHLPESATISVYLRQKSGNAKMFKQKVAICLADLSTTDVICEKVSYFFGISSEKWQAKSKRYAEKFIAPNKSFFSRTMGLLKLVNLCTQILAGNIRSLLRKTSKNKSTSAILQLKIRSKDE